MKNPFRILLGFVIFCTSVISAKAVTITGQPPHYGTAVDYAIDNAWTAIISDAEIELSKYDNQKKLAKGFANANTYTVSTASLEGYQDYSLFALMSGITLSAQMPDFSIDKDYIKNMRYEIEKDGDIYSGAGIGASLINAGINAGFIIPGLYINFKYGYLSLNGKDIANDLDGFLYKTSIYGIGINQVLVWPHTIVPGLFRWRGISIGSGFYYSKTETDITILKSLITQSYSYLSNTYILRLDPSFKIDINSNTMTVPMEITTSIKLFYVFNLSLGTGVDFNYGSSEIKLKTAGTVTTDYDAALTDPGYVTIDGGTKKQKPVMINPKITAGLGFNLSIVKIDIPVAIYYLESGFSIGLSAGIIW